jgi:hypothetical protein
LVYRGAGHSSRWRGQPIVAYKVWWITEIRYIFANL